MCNTNDFSYLPEISKPGNHSEVWISAALALALLSTLFPLPQPVILSNHPWKVEFLTTLFLFGYIIFEYFRDPESLTRIFMNRGVVTSWLIRFIAAFTVWSMISAFWARSPFSVWHHTLIWTEFILFFLLARYRLTAARDIKLITGAFLWLVAITGILCLFDYATLPDFQSLEGTLRTRYAKYAELSATILPIIWIAAAYSRKKVNFILIILAAIIGWVTVMLSLSKGAFLAGLTGSILMFAGSLIFSSRNFRPRILTLFGLWLVVTVAVQAGFSSLSSIPSTTDYITGNADATLSTSVMRIFTWSIGKQMVANNWLFGVGADNFGISFNDSRAKYRLSHPDYPRDEIADDYLVERAHNELLQVTAELGIVGLTLLLLPFGIFLALFVRTFAANKFKLSPIFWAALGGMVAFGLGSMFSSFSFRAVQNGIVFFLVFAVAVSEIEKALGNRSGSRQYTTRKIAPAAMFAALSLCLLTLLASLFAKLAAEYYVFAAERQTDNESSQRLLERAVTLDPDFAGAYLLSAGRSYSEKDYPADADAMRKAIEGGYGVVTTYSALAKYQIEAGDIPAAEKTFDESLRIFPRSVFLRVRYAILLQNAGRTAESDAQMSIARDIEPRQAAGWYNILKIGSVAAFYTAQKDPQAATPNDLLPASAVLQYLDKSPTMPPR